jgi:hypothetical protein
VFLFFRMMGRLLYAIFFLFGGFLFAVPKWILFGTRGGRERRKILKQQKQILRNQKDQ